MTSAPADVPSSSIASPPKAYAIGFVLIVIAAAALYSALNPQYQTGVFNDDAVYLMTARNLWDRDAFPSDSLTYSRPDFPFPGLPVILAPLAKLVEPNWTLAEWLSVVVTVGSLILLGILARTGLSVNQTLVVLALYAFNPGVARYSGVLMPAPYLIIAILGCLLILQTLRRGTSPLKTLGLGCVLGWGSLIRPEASLLLLTIPVALIYHRRWKDVALVLLIPIFCWAFFLAHRAHMIEMSGSEYGGDLAALASYWPHHLSELFPFAIELLEVYFAKIFVALPVPFSTAHPIVTPIVTALGSAMTIIGVGELWMERRFDRGLLLSMGLFSVGYFMVHVFWHVPVPRYGLILLPFILIAIVAGISRTSRSAPLLGSAFGAMIVAVLLVYLYRDTLSVHESLWKPDPLKVVPEKTLKWIRDHTSTSDRVLSTIAPSIVLYTNRSAVNVLPAANEDEFQYLLSTQRLTYIVDRRVRGVTSEMDIVHDPNHAWDRIRRWLQLFPTRYTVVYENPWEKVTIYKVSEDGGFVQAYARYLSAMKKLQSGNANDTIAALRSQVSSFPGLGSAQNALGVLDYETHSDLDEAEDSFLEAIVLLPDDPVSLLNLASLYNRENRRKESYRYLLEALRVSTENGERGPFMKKIIALHEAREIDLPQGFPTS